MTDTVAAYRIVKTKWDATAFDGEGARLYGGRWNSKGTPCVYLAGSESLALLEMLVHLSSADLREAYSVFELQIPVDQLLQVKADDLPPDWQEDPAPPDTAYFGDDWLRSGQSAALWVPSSIVPRERNMLLNPRHSAFASIVAGARKLSLQIDPRLK